MAVKTVKSKTLPRVPYYQPFGCTTFETGGITFHVGCARGFNAMGLIGTEHNGVFLLSVTHQRLVFDQHLGLRDCWSETPGNVKRLLDERDRILNLDPVGLEALIIESASICNPFQLVRAEKFAKLQDAKLRRAYTIGKFRDGRYPASFKRGVVHETERFIVARMFGGVEHARTRFTKRMYSLLSNDYGHIAHFNRMGFFEAQLLRQLDFDKNLELLATMKTSYGYSVLREGDEDLYMALSKIAKHYRKQQPDEY